MAEIISQQTISNFNRDADDAGKALNTKAIIKPRYGALFKSLPLAIQEVIETGGYEPFATEVLLKASVPTLTKKAAVALDTHNVFLWENSIWVNKGSILNQAKDYANEKANLAEANAKSYADEKKAEAIKAAATDATEKADAALAAAKEDIAIKSKDIVALVNVNVERVGDALSLFTNEIIGEGDKGFVNSANITSVNLAKIGGVSKFKNLATYIASRAVPALYSGRTYQAKFAFLRTINSADPLNDAIEVGIEYLNHAKQSISHKILETLSIKVASGLIERTYDLDFGSAVYARPWIRIFGTDSETAIVYLEIVDVTEFSQLINYVDSNPLFKPVRLEADSVLDEITTAGIYHVPTEDIAVSLGLPSATVGQLIVGGYTQAKGYVFQTFIDREGASFFRYKTTEWKRWKGVHVAVVSSDTNLDNIIERGTYAINDSAIASIENNFPFIGAGSSGTLIVTDNSENTLVSQHYICRQGTATRYKTANSGWGTWSGVKNSSNSIFDVSEQTKQALIDAKEFANNNPLFKPQRLEADSVLDEITTAGIYHVPTSAIAVALSLPSERLGQLIVGGYTQSNGYVFQTYIDINGSSFFRYKSDKWNKWNGELVKNISTEMNLNDLDSRGTYLINDSTIPSVASNFPFIGAGSSGTLIVSSNTENTLISQHYLCRQGSVTRYRTANSGWGTWSGVSNSSGLLFDVSKALTAGQVNQVIVTDMTTITPDGHLDNCFNEGFYHINTSSVASKANGFPIIGSGGLLTVKKNSVSGAAILQTWQTYSGFAYRWGSANSSKPNWQAWRGYTIPKNMIVDLSKLYTSENNIVVFGSSTMWYLSDEMTELAAKYGKTLFNHGVSGDTTYGAGFAQGSNIVKLKFPDGVIKSGVAQAVEVTASFGKPANLQTSVELSNGVKGLLSANATTFKPTNLTADLVVDPNQEYQALRPDWAFLKEGIYIVDIGKNNVSLTIDNSEEILEQTYKIIDAIPKGSRFIVGGHFTNYGYNDNHRTVIEKVNAALELRYGLKYFDINELLFDDATWTELGLTKTANDLTSIEKRQLPPSLSRNASHLSEAMDKILARLIENKLLMLGYI